MSGYGGSDRWRPDGRTDYRSGGREGDRYASNRNERWAPDGRSSHGADFSREGRYGGDTRDVTAQRARSRSRSRERPSGAGAPQRDDRWGDRRDDRSNYRPDARQSSVNPAPLARAIQDARKSYGEGDRFSHGGAGFTDGRDGDRPSGPSKPQSSSARRDDDEEGAIADGKPQANSAPATRIENRWDGGGGSAGGAAAGIEEEDGDVGDDDDESPEDREARLLAESRARRAAILAKRSVAAPTATALGAGGDGVSAGAAAIPAAGAAPPAPAAAVPAPKLPVAAAPSQASTSSTAAAPSQSAAPAAPPSSSSVAPAAVARRQPTGGSGAPGASLSRGAAASLLSMFAEDVDDDAFEEETARKARGGGGGAGRHPLSAPLAGPGAARMGEVAGLAPAGSARAATNAAAVAEGSEGPAGGRGAPRGGSTLADNWDDAEGYYRPVPGELLDGRYEVLGKRGQGVFSSVVFCRDTKATVSAAAAAGGAAGDGDDDDVDATVAAAAEGTITTAAAPTAKGAAGGVVRHHAALATGSSPFVAVKIVRSNDTMRRAGMKELDLLRALATADPRGKYHCVRLLATFEHRNHLCLVFEPLAMNLKEVQNKFGKGVGIALVAVRAYAKQLLLSLALLAKLRVIHADIKPHNVLANDKYNVIKLADFGSAFREDDPDNEPTPYLVSRFYRAPEIILGSKHSPALDMWSVACCLFELYTGAPLFPGDDNNDMLWRFQALKGHFPHRMIRAHLRACETLGLPAHFDSDLLFKRTVLDPVTKTPVIKRVEVTDPLEDLGAKLAAKRASDDDKRDVAAFRDLLDKMTALDPTKRVGVREALAHPFIKGRR